MHINTNYINQNFRTQFRAHYDVSNPNEHKEKEGLSIGAKYLLGLSLATLAIAGVCLVKKGSLKNKINPDEIPTPKDPFPYLDDIPELNFDDKNMTLAAFKKEGKFNKGKALLNGKDYTGSITYTCPTDGSNVVMEYFYGDLQKSTKTAKDGTNIFNKEYFYLDDEEKLSHCIITKNGKDEIINLTEKRAKAKSSSK